MKLRRAISVLLFATALAGCASGHHDRPAARTPSPQPSLPVATIVTTVPVADQAVSMAFDGRYLWVGSTSGGVTQVDTTISQPIRTTKLGGRPAGIAVTAEGVWVADSAGSRVSLLDPGSGTVEATVPVAADPLGFAQVGRELWVFSQSQQRASVIDPRTATVIRTVALPGLGAGYPATADGAVWVPDLAGTTRSVWQVDPAGGVVTRRIATADHPAEIAFGFGSGWVTDDTGVTRFDPGTGRQQARITGLGTKLDGVAATPDAMWVVSIAGNRLSRIDPGTDKPTGSVAVCTGPRHLTVVGDDIWVACLNAGMLVRVHPTAS